MDILFTVIDNMDSSIDSEKDCLLDQVPLPGGYRFEHDLLGRGQYKLTGLRLGPI